MTIGTPRRVIPLVPRHAVTEDVGRTGAQDRALETPAAALPLSLYIHVPWCVRKCPYCDFNSHELAGPLPEEDYLAALLADLEVALPEIWGRRVGTVFLGGGTPSVLSAAGVDRLLAGVRARVPLTPDAEITLEANPGTFEVGRYAGYRDAGVNRLSVGVQSFQARHLQALGRIHGVSEAEVAVAEAARVFDRFNIDLMWGLPGQTLDELQADIETALGFSPPHVSAYQLTVEPHTPLAANPPVLPDPDQEADLQACLEQVLQAAGYLHYETSAFARPGAACQHNLNYWGFGDYLGIGAGAHSKLTHHDRIERQVRHRSPRAYFAGGRQGDFLQERREVPATEQPFEFCMNALRLNEGVPKSWLRERTRLGASEWAAWLSTLKGLETEGWLVPNTQRLAPTEKGRRFLNPLLQHFLPD